MRRSFTADVAGHLRKGAILLISNGAASVSPCPYTPGSLCSGQKAAAKYAIHRTHSAARQKTFPPPPPTTGLSAHSAWPPAPPLLCCRALVLSHRPAYSPASLMHGSALPPAPCLSSLTTGRTDIKAVQPANRIRVQSGGGIWPRVQQGAIIPRKRSQQMAQWRAPAAVRSARATQGCRQLQTRGACAGPRCRKRNPTPKEGTGAD